MCDGEPLPCFFLVEWKSLISGRVERALDSGLGLLFVSPGKLLLTPSSTNGHWTASVHLPLVGKGYPVSQKKKPLQLGREKSRADGEPRPFIKASFLPSFTWVDDMNQLWSRVVDFSPISLINDSQKKCTHTNHIQTRRHAWKTVAPDESALILTGKWKQMKFQFLFI